MADKTKKADLKEKSVTSGVNRNGIVDNIDYKKELTGTQGIANYNEMRLNDATVRAAMLVCTLPILAARWSIEAASDLRQDKKIAEFVEECLFKDMTRSWQETLNEVLLFLVFGRMPFEKVWKFRKDGMIGLKKLSSIWPGSIYSWKLKNGEIGILQKTIDGEFETPIDKLVVFVNQKEGDNWEGLSILRSAFKHWFFKDKLYMIDVIGAERQGLGIPFAKEPTGVSKEDREEMEDALSNIRANEKSYLIWKGEWEVGFLDTKAGSLKDLKFTIQHHERQITKNVLAQFLELGGQGGGGSYALSQDQSKLFLLSLEATANYIRDNFNKYVIKDLVDYNFTVEKYPELKFEKIGNVDYQKLVTALTGAITAGLLTPDSNIEDYLRDIMDLPEFTGERSIEVEDVQPMLDELDSEVNDMTGESAGNPGTQEEDPANPGFDMEGKPMADPNTAGWNDSNWLKASEYYNLDITMFGGAVGQPLSEETKKKISDALKGRGKGKGAKGKKTANPEVTKKNKEVAKLRKEAKDFNDSVRREVLEMKVKGIKLSPQDQAKKQLEWFDKKKGISDKIDKLKNEISEIKSKTPIDTKTTTKPAVKPAKKAHEHIEATDEAILKMSEDLSNAIKNIK